MKRIADSGWRIGSERNRFSSAPSSDVSDARVIPNSDTSKPQLSFVTIRYPLSAIAF